MEYTIIAEVDIYIGELIESINRRISEGWKPHGGLCSSTGRSGMVYLYQAMVRNKPLTD